jgi:hypothetical protein
MFSSIDIEIQFNYLTIYLLFSLLFISKILSDSFIYYEFKIIYFSSIILIIYPKDYLNVMIKLGMLSLYRYLCITNIIYILTDIDIFLIINISIYLLLLFMYLIILFVMRMLSMRR